MELICPLTKCIFKEPVTASDGFVYEKKAIDEWFNTSDLSPTLNIQLCDKSLIPNMMIKYKVKSYIKQNPEKIALQYEYELCTFEQFKLLEKKNLLDISEHNLILIFTLLTINDLDYMLSVIDDVEQSLHNGNKIIHYVCKYSCDDIVNYMINYYITNKNDTDITCVNNFNVSPIHIICGRNSFDNVRKIIHFYNTHHLDINCKTNILWTPLNYICKYGNRDAFNYIISNGANMTHVTLHGENICDHLNKNLNIE